MNPKGLAKPFDHLRFAASSQGVFHIRGAQLPPLSLFDPCGTLWCPSTSPSIAYLSHEHTTSDPDVAPS